MSAMSTNSSAYPTRPPLLRGNTVPLYVRTSSSSSATQEQPRQPEGPAQTSSAHPDKYSTFGRREQAGGPISAAASSSRSMAQHWQLPPTPPLSTSPGSVESSHTEDAYFPSISAGMRVAKSNGGHGPSPLSPVTSPTITSSPASFQLLRNTRAPITHSSSAPMRIENSSDAYVLSAAIGPGFDSSCITIAMRKNNILDIVADRWDLERDCHHEWQVQFDRDADMNGVHASYLNGILTVTVKRLNHSFGRPPYTRS